MAEIIAYNSEEFKGITSNFVGIATEKIINAFTDPHSDENILSLKHPISEKQPNEHTSRRASNHIFPLLRVIHLYKTLTQHKKCFKVDKSKLDEINKLISFKLFENLQNRVNQQISNSILQNSMFDTAELVLSIEGLLLIDEKRRVDENLLTKAFEILQVNQKYNLNWRPLKPFVTSPQGDILLPLSIEIANSLLRICKLFEVRHKYYFHDFFSIFENYSKWLMSNVSQCSIRLNNTT